MRIGFSLITIGVLAAADTTSHIVSDNSGSETSTAPVTGTTTAPEETTTPATDTTTAPEETTTPVAGTSTSVFTSDASGGASGNETTAGTTGTGGETTTINFSTPDMSKLCAPFDIMFVQDTTGSFADDQPLFAEVFAQSIGLIERWYPERTKIGLSTFRDKPIWEGQSNNYCYKLVEPLNEDVGVIKSSWHSLVMTEGADQKEDHYQAALNTALDPAVGWRDIQDPSEETDGTKAGARAIIWLTDSTPHFEGDVPKIDSPKNDGKFGDQCRESDYLDPKTFKDVVVNQNNVMALSLFTGGKDLERSTRIWNWVNEELLGQPDAFAQALKPNSSTIHRQLEEAFYALLLNGCGPAIITELSSESTVSGQSGSGDSTATTSGGNDGTGSASVQTTDSDDTDVAGSDSVQTTGSDVAGSDSVETTGVDDNDVTTGAVDPTGSDFVPSRTGNGVTNSDSVQTTGGDGVASSDAVTSSGQTIRQRPTLGPLPPFIP